jgi:hypothetical protein
MGSTRSYPEENPNVKAAHVTLMSALMVMACGPVAKDAEPATTELAPPVATAVATDSATVVATAPPPTSEPTTGGSCPLFCSRTESCSRPKIADASLGGLTCGSFSMGKLDGGPREPCPESCCRPKGPGKGEDRDADGLFDALDRCPDQPEDIDGFRDEDGCPDPDNDRDGLADVDDQCCYVAEDMDGNQDLDGCPEP